MHKVQGSVLQRDWNNNTVICTQLPKDLLSVAWTATQLGLSMAVAEEKVMPFCHSMLLMAWVGAYAKREDLSCYDNEKVQANLMLLIQMCSWVPKSDQVPTVVQVFRLPIRP